jgi:hypothetical protein
MRLFVTFIFGLHGFQLLAEKGVINNKGVEYTCSYVQGMPVKLEINKKQEVCVGLMVCENANNYETKYPTAFCNALPSGKCPPPDICFPAPVSGVSLKFPVPIATTKEAQEAQADFARRNAVTQRN